MSASEQETTAGEVFFVDGTAKIATPDGLKEVPGVCHSNAPGLLVTMASFGLFEVTHERTGMRMSARYERASSAMLVLAQFAAIGSAYGVDYTKDRDELVSALKACAAKPVPFKGSAVTDAAGTRPSTCGSWLQWERDPAHQVVGEFPWESPNEDPGNIAHALLNALPSPDVQAA